MAFALVSPTWELSKVRQALCAHPGVIHLWVQFRDYMPVVLAPRKPGTWWL